MWIQRSEIVAKDARIRDLETQLVAANTSLEWMRARLNVSEAERTVFLSRLLPGVAVAPSVVEQINPAGFAATVAPTVGIGTPATGASEIDDEQEIPPEAVADARRALRKTIAEAQVDYSPFEDPGDALADKLGIGLEADGRVAYR